jgi:CheY-like chemotaxis protein
MPTTTAVAPVPSAPPALLGGIKLLIVDDDADARELLAAAFLEMGARVHVVDCADTAVEALGRERPHVIVSDIGMPGQDGYTLMQRIRDDEARYGHQRLPAVALTAYATADDVKRSMAAGYDVHVAKPVDALTLAHTIVDLVGMVPIDDAMDTTRPVTLSDNN